jgi:hypothetical protein
MGSGFCVSQEAKYMHVGVVGYSNELIFKIDWTSHSKVLLAKCIELSGRSGWVSLD